MDIWSRLWNSSLEEDEIVHICGGHSRGLCLLELLGVTETCYASNLHWLMPVTVRKNLRYSVAGQRAVSFSIYNSSEGTVNDRRKAYFYMPLVLQKI